MTRSMPKGARLRRVVLRLLAAITGALACVALVTWTLNGGIRHDNAALGVNAALSSLLISSMVWNFTRKGEAYSGTRATLRESQEHLRLFIEGVLEYAIITLDCRGRVVDWNAGAKRIIGFEPEEIIGQSVAEFYILEDVAAGKPSMDLKMATEVGQWLDEGWRIRADGTHFWATVLITPLKDDNGKLRGFSNLMRDIGVGELPQVDAALVAAAEQPAILGSAHFSSIDRRA